jgi:copper chaperone CopZ
MKNILIYIFLVSSMVIFGCATQKQATVLTETQIKTSAQCGMCKTSIESKVRGLKGVKSATLVLENQVLKVKYNESIISIKDIELAINSIGYDANDSPANLEVYDKLPLCCKKE